MIPRKHRSRVFSQKRCVESLADKWEDFTFMTTRTSTSLANIPASVLRKLLPLSMARAKNRVDWLTSRKRRWEEKYRSLEYYRETMGICWGDVQDTFKAWRGNEEFGKRKVWAARLDYMEFEMRRLDVAWLALDIELRKK
jgi:hypothetical protein